MLASPRWREKNTSIVIKCPELPRFHHPEGRNSIEELKQSFENSVDILKSYIREWGDDQVQALGDNTNRNMDLEKRLMKSREVISRLSMASGAHAAFLEGDMLS